MIFRKDRVCPIDAGYCLIRKFFVLDRFCQHAANRHVTRDRPVATGNRIVGAQKIN
jgi:hypothetical protein